MLRSQSFVLELLTKCFNAQWQAARLAVRSKVDPNPADEKAKLAQKSAEEQLVLPPLEEALANMMMRLLSAVLYKPPSRELSERAAGVVFHLSATNFDAVFSLVLKQMSLQNADDCEQTALCLLEHLYLNATRLSLLIKEINKAGANFKKSSQQYLARALRKAIWNWIDNCPIEFLALCQSGGRMLNNPDLLFELFDSWATKNKHAAREFWPVQTMLLVLCPDLLLKVALTQASTKESISKAKFVELLTKSLKGSKQADIAAVSIAVSVHLSKRR